MNKPLNSAQSRKRVISPKPEARMLTPSEIESLQRDKMEAIELAMREFSKLPRLLTPEELAAIR